MPKGKLGKHTGEETGRNNPSKSTEITTGTYRKASTTREEAREGEDIHKQAQDAKVPPRREGKSRLTDKADSQLREAAGERRTGSDSNARGGRKQSRLHESHRAQNTPDINLPLEPEEADHDLRPSGADEQRFGEIPLDRVAHERTAADVKDLHRRFNRLTRDELRRINLLPAGTRLQEGETYLDLRDLARGAFVAGMGMVVAPSQEIVAKHELDYQIWDYLSGQSDASAEGTAQG